MKITTIAITCDSCGITLDDTNAIELDLTFPINAPTPMPNSNNYQLCQDCYASLFSVLPTNASAPSDTFTNLYSSVATATKNRLKSGGTVTGDSQ
jgi:hypothetical protein